MHIKADACVIGSGAGGGAFAWGLAEAGKKVIILEKGLPVAKLEENEDPVEGALRVINQYQPFRVSLALSTPAIPILYASCLGGSAAMNAGTCFRPPDHVIQKWREDGLEVFTPDYVDKLSRKLEEFLPIEPVSRDAMGKSGIIFERGIKALGFSGGPVKRNAAGCRGCGSCVIGCPLNAKKAPHLSFIPRVQALGGEVYTGANVERVEIEKGKVKGVRGTFMRGKMKGTKFKVTAPVVGLAAGAIWTPVILVKSGLRNPHIGRHLHLHPGVVAGAIFDEEIECWKGVPQSYYSDEYLHEGIIFLVGAVPPPIGGMLVPGCGIEHQRNMQEYIRFTDAGALISDTSEGRVRVMPGGLPLVSYKLLQSDIEKMRKALKILCQIYFAAGAKKVFPVHIGGLTLKSEKELDKIDTLFEKRKFMLGGSLHPLGTCRMGTSPENSVVNQFCEFHGIKGLFIVDGSVLPTSTAINPQQTIMTLALHASGSGLNI